MSPNSHNSLTSNFTIVRLHLSKKGQKQCKCHVIMVYSKIKLLHLIDETLKKTEIVYVD